MLSAFHSKDLTLFLYYHDFFFIDKVGAEKVVFSVWDLSISMLPGHGGYEKNEMKVKCLFIFSKSQRVLTAG